MLRAIEDVAGRAASDADRTTFTGCTDSWIAGELLRRAGHSGDRAGVERVHARYLELLAVGRSAYACTALPGALALGEALAKASAEGRCHEPLLLTGNLREGARHKLQAAGLDGVYRCEGAFGDLHDDRIDVAREAVALAPGARHVIIGDAPADLRAARAVGARCVLDATGPVPADELARLEPDALLESLVDVTEESVHRGGQASCRVHVRSTSSERGGVVQPRLRDGVGVESGCGILRHAHARPAQ